MEFLLIMLAVLELSIWVLWAFVVVCALVLIAKELIVSITQNTVEIKV